MTKSRETLRTHAKAHPVEDTSVTVTHVTSGCNAMIVLDEAQQQPSAIFCPVCRRHDDPKAFVPVST